MQEQLSEIFYYIKGTLKYKWTAFVVASVICISGWIAILSMPDKYASEARVHVETRTMLQPLLHGMAIQSDVRGLLRVMQMLMFTKNNLEQIIKLSDLSKTVKTEGDRQALVEQLKKDIQINGGAEDIFTIKYQAKDPIVAKNVVQAVLTVFSEQAQLNTSGNTTDAQRFIENQIQDYENRLRNAEKARENFKRANLGLLPDEGGDQIGQIQEMTTALEEANLNLKEAISRKQTLQEQLNEALISEEDESGEEANGQASQADIKINALKQRRDELLIKFTNKHPEVVHIDKSIKDLEKLRSDKLAKVEASGNLNAAVMTNPYTQSIKVALNEADANIASMRSRVEIYQKRLEKAQTEINARLSIETEMQNLNRDYSAIKSNYENLLASREQARMTGKVGDQAEVLKFKIADVPNTPLKPSSPNRALLYSGILVGGLALGLCVSFLIHLLRPTVMSPSQLRQLTGLPVLGSVSLKFNNAKVQKNRKELIIYSVMWSALIVVYSGFMALDVFDIKIFGLFALLTSNH
jgi:polysaccharide chain length determinant protein (PEP-CTERM system associated)